MTVRAATAPQSISYPQFLTQQTDYHEDPAKWKSTSHVHTDKIKPDKDRVRNEAEERLKRSSKGGREQRKREL